jgi:uncharacterized protein (TIGR00295 family)
MDEKEAIALLRKYASDEESFQKVLAHSKLVQKIAVKIAKDIMDNGYFVDLDFIETASLLHDIGRFKCPPNTKDSIKHGVEGAEIMLQEKLPHESLVCARHLGAGITKEDIINKKLPLAPEDYVPETIEEKIIAHADNLTAGDKEITIEQSIERFRKEIGEEFAERIKKLNEEIEELRGKK